MESLEQLLNQIIPKLCALVVRISTTHASQSLSSPRFHTCKLILNVTLPHLSSYSLKKKILAPLLATYFLKSQYIFQLFTD